MLIFSTLAGLTMFINIYTHKKMIYIIFLKKILTSSQKSLARGIMHACDVGKPSILSSMVET